MGSFIISGEKDNDVELPLLVSFGERIISNLKRYDTNKVALVKKKIYF